MAKLIKLAKMAGIMHEADHLVIASIIYRCTIHCLLLICLELLPIGTVEFLVLFYDLDCRMLEF